MDASLFEKFNETFDVDGLKEDAANAGNPTERVEVPHGDYEVAITKLELGESKKGLPQAKVWFKIVAGDYKGQLIFMNQNVTGGFQIHTMNEFLESLEAGLPVVFEDFVQYAELLDAVFKAVDGRFEYQLAYGENSKGFNTYNIVQKFVKE